MLDVCAVLLTPKMTVELVASQADKDDIGIFCYGDMPRMNLRRALRIRGLLQLFDGLLYEEIMLELTAEELRRLGDAERTYWMRTPAEIEYTGVLDKLGPRRRLLPRVVRLAEKLRQLDLDGSFQTDA